MDKENEKVIVKPEKTDKKENIHAGHRDRVKNRFLSEGLDNFSDHNVLELLLFYGIPYRDTNELAHELLNKFGSYSAVFDAKFYELESVVGKHCAVLIKLIMAASRRYHIDRDSSEGVYRTPAEIGTYLVNFFRGRENEVMYLLSFDSKMKLINISKIGEGVVNSCHVDFRVACETALRHDAAVAVLAHNHPSGIALPSSNDISTTHKLAGIMANLNILLYDHIVVGNNDFVSFRDSGFLNND